MALTILNNIAAIAAENQLNITSGNLNSTLMMLSSGSRINSGADDPAGLAIANGLQANVAALTQSSSNATGGVGELQVADGALSQVTTLLDRAVTLATESATGTVSNPQRTALDAEYQSIKAEIDSIGSTTNYNGGQVFTTNTLNVFLSDGSTSGSSNIGVTTGALSSNGLSLGGAVAATGALTQAAGTPAVAATDYVATVGDTITGATVATGTLASVAAQTIVDGEQVTVGGTTYTFKTTLDTSNATNEVWLGAAGNLNSQAMTNLAAAINGQAGGSGVSYGVGTVANTYATATEASGASNAAASTVTLKASIDGVGGAGTGNNVVLTSATAANITANGGAGTVLGSAGDVVTAVNGDTLTVGGKTYTFIANGTQFSSSGVANEVNIGASTNTSAVANLVAAINQATQVGSQYSTQTSQNANVTATVDAVATRMDVAASVAGAAGDNISTSVTTTGGYTWHTTNLAGGADAGAAKVATAGDTVTIGSGGYQNAAQVFTFVNALSSASTANQVLVGATEAASLANLANAINGGSGAGTNYSYGTNGAANTAVTAVTGANSNGFDTLTLTATTKGLAGNSIATQATGGNNTFGFADLAGGTAGSVNDLLTQADAQAALTLINSAVAAVASLRGNIGSTVNRLQSASSVINNQTQNLTAAENNATAADIPSTVAKLSGYSILMQTGISALAQSNQQQQLVLKLLQ